jgi:hypothetical protein
LAREPPYENVHARGFGECFNVFEDGNALPVTPENAAAIWIALTKPRDTAAGHGFNGEIKATDPREQRSDRQPHGINLPS